MDIADDPLASRGPRQGRDAGRDEPATTGPASTIVEDAMALQAQLQAQRALLESGTPGRARIASVSETGILVQFNPEVVLDLSVSVGEQLPYNLRLTTAVTPAVLEQLRVGADVSVRVDPSEPHRVAIDWSTA